MIIPGKPHRIIRGPLNIAPMHSELIGYIVTPTKVGQPPSPFPWHLAGDYWHTEEFNDIIFNHQILVPLDNPSDDEIDELSRIKENERV